MTTVRVLKRTPNRGASRLEGDQEIVVCDRLARRHLCEQDRGRRPGAVRIIHDLAIGLIVDNAIIAIERGGANAKLIGADDIARRERREDAAGKPDGVIGAVEVGDDIDVGRGVERGGEHERVLGTAHGVAAGHDVVAVAAAQYVVAGAAEQLVVILQAKEGIVAPIAIQIVETAHAMERVAAALAVQNISAVVALELVVVARAGQVLDGHERVAGGIAAAGKAGQQRHGHGGRRSVIGSGIDAITAIEIVGAAVAFQRIVAAIAIDVVVLVAAPQPIVVLRADEIFDVDEDIAFGLAAVAVTNAGMKIDDHAGVGGTVIGGITATLLATAVEIVGALAARENVAAGALEMIVAAIAVEEPVVTVGARKIIASLGAEFELDRHSITLAWCATWTMAGPLALLPSTEFELARRTTGAS